MPVCYPRATVYCIYQLKVEVIASTNTVMSKYNNVDRQIKSIKTWKDWDTVNANKHGVDHEKAHKNYIPAKYLDASSANVFIKAVISVQY